MDNFSSPLLIDADLWAKPTSNVAGGTLFQDFYKDIMNNKLEAIRPLAGGLME